MGFICFRKFLSLQIKKCNLKLFYINPLYTNLIQIYFKPSFKRIKYTYNFTEHIDWRLKFQ